MFEQLLTALKMNRAFTVIFLLVLSTVSTTAQSVVGADFLDVISGRAAAKAEKVSKRKNDFEKVCPIDKSSFAKKVLSEYGAMFVTSDKVISPPTCRFLDDGEVASFQSKLNMNSVVVHGIQMQLQKAAADALNAVVADAVGQGIRIRTLDGAIAGARSYSDTVRLWNSRFATALRYWSGRRRISPEEAEAIIEIPLEQQVERVMAWESQGMMFGTNRRSSIFASTAPPGASQHLSLIAIDIAPPLTPTVIALMNAHGWFQTVKGDKPHFTFLGLTEKELPGRGLKALIFDGTLYWVPNISDSEVNP